MSKVATIHTLYPNRNPLPPWRRALPPAAVAQGVCRRGGVVKGYVGAESDHAPTPGGAPARADPHPLYNRGSEIFEILKVFTLVR